MMGIAGQLMGGEGSFGVASVGRYERVEEVPPFSLSALLGQVEALTLRVEALEAAVSIEPARLAANIANKVANRPANTANQSANSEEVVSRSANTDRKAYMRDLMRKKRAAKKAGAG